jgi:hypothetical protein
MIQLAGFIFAFGFYSLSSKVKSVHSWQGQHLKHLLFVNCNYFIPNVVSQQTYWFIDKIHMHLTPGHCEAQNCEPVNKSKTLPVAGK